MHLITTTKEKETHKGIGGKAKNLLRLNQLGAPVPKWTVIPQEVMCQQASDQFVLPPEILNAIAIFFGENHTEMSFAVRSSAIDEDGASFSFAGQFESFLHVSFNQLTNAIVKIWQSANAPRVQRYYQENGIKQNLGIAVIIQEMVSSDVSGVAFGAHPVSGDLNTKVISSVYGLGEGLVSGELNADTFTLSSQETHSEIVNKPYAYQKAITGTGISKQQVPIDRQKCASLGPHQLTEVSNLLTVLNQKLGTPQDIEFAYKKDQLYLLQTRPITTLKNSVKGEYTLWDNSNIIESYPGVTTPLTYSFILKMYEMVYRQFVGIMGVNIKEINAHSDVFSNTLGLVRGRVYYNLLNWYKMLAMLPGYSLNASFMEKMMGVKERFELSDEYKMNKRLAWFRILKMIFKMAKMQLRLKKERQTFLDQLNKIMNQYKSINFNILSPQELITLYRTFEESLLLKWKAPLINDFFAMIWFGILEKQTQRYFPEEPNIHNDLLCGSQDIISVEPILKTFALSKMISSKKEAKQLFLEHAPSVIWLELNKGKHPEVKAAINDYIARFGDRCVGELKLETIAYSQDPTLFIKVIKAYVSQGIVSKNNNDIENQLRHTAQTKVSNKFRNHPLKNWWFNWVTKNARDVVSNRENLRYERTRGFGMVRNIFIALGEKWTETGQLLNPKDIFYLELNEIKSIENGNLPTRYLETIESRKKEFKQYHDQEPPQERFFSYGNNFSDEYIYSLEKIEAVENHLKGIGCCPGRVKGKVRLVNHPNEIESLNGDILITTSTDPGWVTLFPTASAIIVERGSLLSHSAIVSREMGIPCIVSVTGLMRSLKNGDEILMDGSTGQIKKL